MARRTLILLTIIGMTYLSGGAVAGQAQPARSMPATFTHLQMHLLWRQTISPNADSAPACLAHVGKRKIAPLLYVLAANNGSNCNPGNPVRKATLFAFDASNGTVRWTRSTSGPARCSTAGPVVDPAGHWV